MSVKTVLKKCEGCRRSYRAAVGSETDVKGKCRQCLAIEREGDFYAAGAERMARIFGIDEDAL